MAHPISWIEISANNRGEAADFYNAVFGWPYNHIEEMSYTTADTGQGNLGVGLNDVSESVPPGTVVVYFHTDDIADTLEKAKAQGGDVILDAMPVPTVGSIAMFKDPTGNVIGLLQPDPMPQS